MGIDGLLQLLKPITEKQHISSFKGMRAGVDIMPWIYRGCYSCSFDRAQNIYSTKYLYYILDMVEILNYYQIKPTFVFDGRSIEMKNETHERREKQKKEYQEKGMKFLKDGNLQEARKYLSRSIFLDEEIISTTMNLLLTKNLDFLVAPYEADCQIAKLKKQGLIDVAISEDSDLLVYGVNTILKLNQLGDCDYIDPNKWSFRDVDNKFLKEYLSMNKVNRIEAAVLAGSDYSQSIRGIGIKRAVRNLYQKSNMKNVITKLKQDKVYSDKIPQNYEQVAEKSKLIFLFATVYNPNTKAVENLNPEMVDTDKPEKMTVEELNKIVGDPYPEYIDKEIYCGKTEAKTLNERKFQAVTVRELFSINKQKISLHEVLNRKRKTEAEQIKQQRQEDIEAGVISVREMNPGTDSGKKTSEKMELTEQEKQKRKQERKQRIFKLQDMMSAFMNAYDDGDDDQKNELPQKDNHAEEGAMGNGQGITPEKIIQIQQEVEKVMSRLGNNNKLPQINSTEKEKSLSSESQMEEQSSSVSEKQSSQSVDLGFLNPFVKQAPNPVTKSPIKKSS